MAAEVDVVHLAEVADFVFGPAHRVPERHVENHRQRTEQHQAYSGLSRPRSIISMAANTPPKYVTHKLGKVPAPDRDNRFVPFEADGDGDEAGVQAEHKDAKDGELRYQRRRAADARR